jgi:hypothetical protein
MGVGGCDTSGGHHSACSVRGLGADARWCHSQCRHRFGGTTLQGDSHHWKRQSPVPVLSAPHRGFSEFTRGLRWVPPERYLNIGLRDVPPAVEDEIRHQVNIERRKKPDRVPGREATRSDACIDCGTTERPHRAHGRCKRCDDCWRYQKR